jgi:hypothetical protein
LRETAVGEVRGRVGGTLRDKGDKEEGEEVDGVLSGSEEEGEGVVTENSGVIDAVKVTESASATLKNENEQEGTAATTRAYHLSHHYLVEAHQKEQYPLSLSWSVEL